MLPPHQKAIAEESICDANAQPQTCWMENVSLFAPSRLADSPWLAIY